MEGSAVNDAWTIRHRALISLTIAGPLAFAVAVLVLGSQRPGYSQVGQFISELLTGSGGIVMQGSFVLFGLAAIALAGILSGRLGSRAASVGSILLAVFGASVIGGGLVPCDDCTNFLAGSPANIFHSIMPLIGFTAMLPVPILLSRAMRSDAALAPKARLSAVLGVAYVLTYVVFMTQAQGPYLGLFQRAVIVLIIVWIELLALELARFRDSRSPSLIPSEGAMR